MDLAWSLLSFFSFRIDALFAKRYSQSAGKNVGERLCRTVAMSV